MKHHGPVSETLDIFLRAERASPGKGSGLRMRSPQRPRLSPYPSRSAPARRPPHRAAITVHSWLLSDGKSSFQTENLAPPRYPLYSVKSKTAFAFLDFPTPHGYHGIHIIYYMAILAPFRTFNPLCMLLTIRTLFHKTVSLAIGRWQIILLN